MRVAAAALQLLPMTWSWHACGAINCFNKMGTLSCHALHPSFP
jgi:hypothetical protein